MAIADPTRTDPFQWTSTTTDDVAGVVTQEKIRAYTDRDPGDTFLPLALEMYGALCLEFDDFLIACAHATLARRQSAIVTPSLIIDYYRQRVSITLQSSQAIAILQWTKEASDIRSSLPQLSSIPFIAFVDLF